MRNGIFDIFGSSNEARHLRLMKNFTITEIFRGFIKYNGGFFNRSLNKFRTMESLTLFFMSTLNKFFQEMSDDFRRQEFISMSKFHQASRTFVAVEFDDTSFRVQVDDEASTFIIAMPGRSLRCPWERCN